MEDRSSNQIVISAQLEMLGLTCDVVSDGEEALAQLNSKDYDLILVDCHMPVMDGYETTREIRLNPRTKNVPIIAITANAYDSNRDLCLEVGMNDFLAKPYWVKDLQEKLQRYISIPSPVNVEKQYSFIEH
ncbi:MAG: response regulator [Prochlorothrix sp.]|nr:response regulator [Prochlorothrix sp.]